MKEAMFYSKKDFNKVKCNLCNHFCIIEDGKSGICNFRENLNGTLYSKVFNRIVAKNIDPIEKKPLYHFLPASYTYSISTVGCNFKCLNCQNYEISQAKEVFGYYFNAETIIKEIEENHLPSISYTYTEPTIYYETARNIGIYAKEKNIKNIFVSNGYMSKYVVNDLKSWLDGINIDLKSFSNEFYKKICKASIKPVLDNIISFKENGIWVEITTLIIPGLNDSEKELKNIAKFIKSVDSSIPWHVSAFYPTYLLTNISPTDSQKVINARLIGLSEGLKYVYTGNIRDNIGANTYCNKCNNLLIERAGYNVKIKNLINNRCSNCNEKINGIFING